MNIDYRVIYNVEVIGDLGKSSFHGLGNESQTGVRPRKDMKRFIGDSGYKQLFQGIFLWRDA